MLIFLPPMQTDSESSDQSKASSKSSKIILKVTDSNTMNTNIPPMGTDGVVGDKLDSNNDSVITSSSNSVSQPLEQKKNTKMWDLLCDIRLTLSTLIFIFSFTAYVGVNNWYAMSFFLSFFHVVRVMMLETETALIVIFFNSLFLSLPLYLSVYMDVSYNATLWN